MNLQHEIRTLHLWMERRGFQGIEAQFFETNSTRLQDTLMENSTRLQDALMERDTRIKEPSYKSTS